MHAGYKSILLLLSMIIYNNTNDNQICIILSTILGQNSRAYGVYVSRLYRSQEAKHTTSGIGWGIGETAIVTNSMNQIE